MARPETLFGGMLEFACSSTNAHHSRAGSTAEKRALALCGILTKRHDSADCCDSANKAFYDCESANKALCQNCSKVIIIIGGDGVSFAWVAAAAAPTHACQCSFCRTNHAGANKHAYVCGDIHIYVQQVAHGGTKKTMETCYDYLPNSTSSPW